MLTAYKLKTEVQPDKYFHIGYKCYLNNIPRDLADDLIVTDRDSFLCGWDVAQNETMNKSPRTPRPSVSQ